MHLPPQDAVLLRIFIGEDDKCKGRPLYEALVFAWLRLEMLCPIESSGSTLTFGALV